jgi:hypothetical protein
MSTTEILPTRRRARSGERTAHGGWIPRTFRSSSQSRIVLRAVLASAVILGAEYLLEVVWLDLPYWHRWESFLADPGVQLAALGLVFTLTLLGQWGARYVELWADVRPAFDVPDEEYDAVVRRSLVAFYGRDHVPFALFALVQIAVYGLFRGELPAGFLHVGFLHFFAVTALYCFYRHTVTIQRITALDLADVARARPTLSRVADFSVVVGLTWFAALSALVAYVGFFVGLERGIGLFYAAAVLVLVFVGLLTFLAPVVLLHEALSAAKQERLRRLDAEYEALFWDWRAGDLDRDLDSGLDLLEKRRRNVEAISTWPYRLVSVGELALASLVPTTLSLVQTLGLGG